MSKVSNTFKNIFSLLLQDLINLKHYRNYKKTGININSEELNKIGYTILKNRFQETECDNLYDQIISLVEQYKITTKLSNGTRIEYRGSNNGPDKGMIDIYNIEKSICLNLNFEEIEKTVKSTSTDEIYFTNIHAYINRSVERTRIFHIDNCQPVVYKAFIYLTNVNSIEYGPYSFIKGTHRFSLPVYYNLIRNLFLKNYRSTDMLIYKKKQEIIGMGNKGTVIISNQNGIHRGYPQAKGKERVALVLTYMVVSKLNYIHSTAKEALQTSLKKL